MAVDGKISGTAMLHAHSMLMALPGRVRKETKASYETSVRALGTYKNVGKIYTTVDFL
jgi:hypothetical protein